MITKDVEHRFGTVVLHFVPPVFSKFVEAKTVHLGVIYFEQLFLEGNPLCGIDITFEYGVLGSYAEIKTDLSQSPKAALRGGIVKSHVVGNQNQQQRLLSDQQGWIVRQITTQMTREQHGLNMR